MHTGPQAVALLLTASFLLFTAADDSTTDAFVTTTSMAPSMAPSMVPSMAPSMVPFMVPSMVPSMTPSMNPSIMPSTGSNLPSRLLPVLLPVGAPGPITNAVGKLIKDVPERARELQDSVRQNADNIRNRLRGGLLTRIVGTEAMTKETRMGSNAPSAARKA